MKVIERVVKAAGEPDKTDLWLTEGESPELKVYDKGEWKTISGGSSDSDESSDSGESSDSDEDSTVTVRIIVDAYSIEEIDYPYVVEDYNGASGTIAIKGFTSNLKRLEPQTIPFEISEGQYRVIVDVEVSLGDTVAFVAKIPGKGASCQIVRKVVDDAPLFVYLAVLPTGLYEVGNSGIHAYITGNGYSGVAIVTDDFAFVWPAKQRNNWNIEGIRWSDSFQRSLGFVAYNKETALSDYDGALNTSAIREIDKNPIGAIYVSFVNECTNLAETFLPSMGMLKYLFDHKTEINSFISDAETEYEDEFSKIEDTEHDWWSSTQCGNTNEAWSLMTGSVVGYDSYRGWPLTAAAVCNFYKLT